MTSDYTIFNSKHITFVLSIHTVDGSNMQVSHIGTISTLGLSIPNTFLVPKFMLNLISVRQLCDLGLHLVFSLLIVLRRIPGWARFFGLIEKLVVFLS